MLINVAQEEECRIAVVDKNKLEELYIERAGEHRHAGNIYKGIITNVEPSIQACFVDFGIGKNGFLHISDLQTNYLNHSPKNPPQKERVGRKRPRRDRPPIQECLRRGQEVIVQVIKEGIGTKGPTLTTYLSIPGRYLVLMPGMNRMGISRKIEDDESRKKMREIINDLNLPKDMGFIIRTAGLDRSKRDIQRDLNYLLRLWKVVSKRMKSDPAPTALYQESDLVIRTIRDIYNRNIDRIVCDSETVIKKVRDFLRIAMPRTRCRISYYNEKAPLFTRYNLEQEIAKIQDRHVSLPSGGSLVIDSTEALVAIDINSGRYRVQENAENTAFKINMEATPELARQLRLRDLGGVIVIDFIDMMMEKHRRAVERELRQAVSYDRARTKILRMSQFGIIEMTRQRMRPSLKSSVYMDCPHCSGSGLIKSPESMSIEIMRRIQFAVDQDSVADIQIEVSHEVAMCLQNRKRTVLHLLEKDTGKKINIISNFNFGNDETRFLAHNHRGSAVNLDF